MALLPPPHARIPPRTVAHIVARSKASERRRPGNPTEDDAMQTSDRHELQAKRGSGKLTAGSFAGSRRRDRERRIPRIASGASRHCCADRSWHFGMLTSLLRVPVTVQVRFTAPVNPPVALATTGVVNVVPGEMRCDWGVDS